MAKSNPAHQRLKSLLKETITLLCKNGLEYKDEFCIEALIGITLDKDDIVLVNINETIKSAEAELKELEQPQSSQQEAFEGSASEEDYVAERNFSPSAQSLKKRSVDGSRSEIPASRRKKRRRRSGSSNGDGDLSRNSFSEPEDCKSDIVIIKEEPGDNVDQSGMSFDTDLNWTESDPHLSLPVNPSIHHIASSASSSAMFNQSQHSNSGLSHSQGGNVIAGSSNQSGDESGMTWNQEGGMQTILPPYKFCGLVSPRRKYTYHTLLEAVEHVITGQMTLLRAEKSFGVARATLSRIIKEKRPKSLHVMEDVKASMATRGLSWTSVFMTDMNNQPPV